MLEMNSKYPKLTRDEVRVKYRENTDVKKFQKYRPGQSVHGEFCPG